MFGNSSVSERLAASQELGSMEFVGWSEEVSNLRKEQRLWVSENKTVEE
jgi:hypothetical protein